MTRIGWAWLSAVFFLSLAGVGDALAVSITAPAAGGETGVSENVPELAVVNNSGHVAIAEGSSAMFQWSSTPLNAIIFVSASSDNHHMRWMFNEAVCAANGWGAVQMNVFDPGDGVVAGGNVTIQVKPVQFTWTGVAGFKANDRLVHKTILAEEIRTRTLKFKVTGNSPVQDMQVRFSNPESGDGTVVVTEFDGQASSVRDDGSGIFTITVNVSSSPTGIEHSLTIKGTQESSTFDDIEIDLIDRQPHDPAAGWGIGAAIRYTSVLIDVKVDNKSDEEEETPGVFIFAPGSNPLDVEHRAVVVRKVIPVDGIDAQNYRLYEEKDDSEENPRLQTPLTGEDYYDVNDELDSNGECAGLLASGELRDTAYYVRLKDSDQEEVGGGTCYDKVNFTVVTLDLKIHNAVCAKPHRVGMNKAGSMDATQELYADVTPNAATDNVMVLSPQARDQDMEISAFEEVENGFLFKLLGTKKSAQKGDQTLEFVFVSDGLEVDPKATYPVSVVIPHQLIGSVNQNFTVNVVPKGLNAATSPALWGLNPSDKRAVYFWGPFLQVPVEDQLGDLLAGVEELYEGAMIFEKPGSWHPINQTLANGEYLDPVGRMSLLNFPGGSPYILPSNHSYWAEFEAQNLTIAIPNFAPVNVDFPVRVDVWELEGGVTGRNLSRVNDTTLKIVWSQNDD